MSDSPTPRTDEANRKWPMDRHALAFAKQLEGELNDANRQKLTLSKAMNEGTGDARVDSGEFTFQDWMEIRRRLMEELNEAKSELERFRKREQEFPTHHSLDQKITAGLAE